MPRNIEEAIEMDLYSNYKNSDFQTLVVICNNILFKILQKRETFNDSEFQNTSKYINVHDFSSIDDSIRSLCSSSDHILKDESNPLSILNYNKTLSSSVAEVIVRDYMNALSESCDVDNSKDEIIEDSIEAENDDILEVSIQATLDKHYPPSKWPQYRELIIHHLMMGNYKVITEKYRQQVINYLNQYDLQKRSLILSVEEINMNKQQKAQLLRQIEQDTIDPNLLRKCPIDEKIIEDYLDDISNPSLGAK